MFSFALRKNRFGLEPDPILVRDALCFSVTVHRRAMATDPPVMPLSFYRDALFGNNDNKLENINIISAVTEDNQQRDDSEDEQTDENVRHTPSDDDEDDSSGTDASPSDAEPLDGDEPDDDDSVATRPTRRDIMAVFDVESMPNEQWTIEDPGTTTTTNRQEEAIEEMLRSAEKTNPAGSVRKPAQRRRAPPAKATPKKRKAVARKPTQAPAKRRAIKPNRG
jgi:hypothetical protein